MAGVVTHVPGLIYLVALNAIAAEEPGAVTAVVQLAVYNVLWFAVPIAALALVDPAARACARVPRAATRWGREHEQILVVVTLAALGVYLTLKGLIRLF